SSLDSIHEALRLLELVPRSAQNQDQLLDDQAQALLWLFICTLESKLEKSIERDQRAKDLGLKKLEEFEPNDLNHEDRLLEDPFLYDGVRFNLAAESALHQSLDDAFTLWKQLLGTRRVPAVRSAEQTAASLRLLAALYKLMAKPLQAMETYLLVRDLCRTLGDSLGMASALGQVTRLLLQLECPSYAQLFLEEMESCLQEADSSDSSFLLQQQTCLLLRSQLCCSNHQLEEGLTLLLQVLQNLPHQKTTKVWYVLRAHVLQLVTVYLSLPPACLSLELRQQLFDQGWQMPEMALSEAQKLFRSVILLLKGSDILGCRAGVSDVQFVDCGDNLLLKWQVLADMLGCLEHLVALLSRLEMVSKAKAFCLEAIKLAQKLQSTRWLASFLVLKAQLELQQSDLELSNFSLEHVLFLLESNTELKDSKKQKDHTKIQPKKGKLEGKKPRPPISEPPGEEECFLQGPALELVAPARGLGRADALGASPELKPVRRKRLGFLTHPASRPCCLCSVDGVFAASWTWQLPTLAAAEPEVVAVPQALTTGKARPQRRKKTPTLAPAGPKPRVKRSQRAKPVAVPDTDDVFAVGGSDSEVPPIVIRPVTLPCTPHQKVHPAQPRAAAAARTPFTIFNESSPPASRLRLPRAPKVLGRVKSRLQVTFSDDSDVEDLKAGLTPGATCKKSCAQQVVPPKSSGLRGQGSSARPRRAPRAGAAGERRERATRRAAGRREKEERELLRAVEEEEGAPVAQVCPCCCHQSKGPGASVPTGRRHLPWHRQEGTDGEQEVLRQEASEDIVAVQWLGKGDPLPPKGTLSSALPKAGDVSSLDTVLELLKEAFNCISHCPPSVLYSQLCQLLALATGNQDPLSTAYLLSESVSITTRHQLLSILHRKIHKEKKSAGDVAEQLRGLSLQEECLEKRCHHLRELQKLFTFSPTALGSRERDEFQAQLEQIPSGVAVCVLTLSSLQPGCAGDTLLLTRLEKGTAPLTIRIPAAPSTTPLHLLLRDFDTIQKEQKEANSCTEKESWWLRRFELDGKMKSLIETLEMQVLGCWRGALLPPSPDPALAEAAARLHPQLRCCGFRDTDPTLLKVVLNAAALLTPRDAQALASGLCPAQPHQAQLLLQEVLEKHRPCPKQPPGSLVLVLDKHLQKLPWESMTCLKSLPVTRLPSLRFLLSYSL
ncbi:Separin, partial [Chaetura pelagica]